MEAVTQRGWLQRGVLRQDGAGMGWDLLSWGLGVCIEQNPGRGSFSWFRGTAQLLAQLPNDCISCRIIES